MFMSILRYHKRKEIDQYINELIYIKLSSPELFCFSRIWWIRFIKEKISTSLIKTLWPRFSSAHRGTFPCSPPLSQFFFNNTCKNFKNPEPLCSRSLILFTTFLTQYQINQTLVISVKIMIDFKSFLNRMTGKLIAFFNIFSNLATSSIRFAGTSCRLQKVKVRSN